MDNDSDFFSDSDLSNISIVSNNRKSLNSFPCDTVKTHIGKDSPIALPIPMIPFIDDGGLLTDYDSQSQAVKEKLINNHSLLQRILDRLIYSYSVLKIYPNLLKIMRTYLDNRFRHNRTPR